jgi:HEAT repeat protein
MEEGENSVEKLIDDLYNPEPKARIKAAWLLGVKKEAGAVEPLVKAMDENRDDPYFLATAAAALGLIGEIRALDKIIELLKSSYKVVRAAAAEAIGMIGNDRGVEPLRKALADRSISVQKAADGALKKLVDKDTAL